MNARKKSDDFARSPCAIASTLDLVGDKWSLLVIRDLLIGKATFGQLSESPEHIPTNILAERLRRLEDAGVIVKSAYQERPVRFAYALSAKGKDMGDILRALVRWGTRHIPGTIVMGTAQRAGKPSARHTGEGHAKTKRIG